MSGTTAFLRRSCWAKSNRKNPVSTPSKLKFVNLRAWNVDKTKFCQPKNLLWEIIFFTSFLSESIWYVWFSEGKYFGSSCFVTDQLIKLLLYTEAGTRRNCSKSKHAVNDGGVITLMSCKPFSEARMSLLCFQVVRFGDKSRTSFWYFAMRCLFMLCRFLLSRFFFNSKKKSDKLLRARLKEKISAFVGKWLEHLESR